MSHVDENGLVMTEHGHGHSVELAHGQPIPQEHMMHHMADEPEIHQAQNMQLYHQHDHSHDHTQMDDSLVMTHSHDPQQVVQAQNIAQVQQTQNAHMISAAGAAAAAVAAIDDHLVSPNPHISADAHLHQSQSHQHHMHTTSPSKSKRVQTRRSWTPEEDKRLLELVKADGTNCWSQIATHLEGRVGKQCRERWRNHLDPNIRRDSFTQEEDEHILELVQELGTRWSKIAQRLPGRTENAVKNRYHCFLKNRDTNGSKRARDDKNNAAMGLHKHKRPDKGFMGFDADALASGKGSPEGNFSCNLLGCGKHFSQLSHLLAHRLTHFAEGRHPSSQPAQVVVPATAPVAMTGDPSQRPTDTPAETVMLVRALDGLVDDLLSQIQPRSQGAEGSEEHHKDMTAMDNSAQQQAGHIKVEHHDPAAAAQESMVQASMMAAHGIAHHMAVHGYTESMDMTAQHVEQFVVTDASNDGMKSS